MNEIDELLSRPLPDVPDDGFSARVLARVRTEQRRGWWRVAAVAAACVLLSVLLLPLDAIGREVGAALPYVADSWPVRLAAALTVISLLIERQFARL